MINKHEWWYKLKWKLSEFWCWLTGGHTYADINLRSESFPGHNMTCFYNNCLKCGKTQAWAVSNEALYCAPPLVDYEFNFNYEAEDDND